MANGKIRFGKQSGGELALVIPDGVSNTEVIVPESGVLAKISDINTAGVELKTIASGTATFTASTNNINLTGIGIDVEIGDVIQISGAEDAKNNSEFTVEVITDNNNIIVNQAHSNIGTSKNVAARASDTGVTVKLLAKWYNAPLGLGQDWVSVVSSRASSTGYTNTTNRTIKASIGVYGGVGSSSTCYVSSFLVGFTVNSNSGVVVACIFDIPKNGIYKIAPTVGTPTLSFWLEMR